MQIVINGLLTRYTRAGKGRQLILVPGWADTSLSWQHYSAELSRQFDVTVIDPPGFGGSEAPKTAWGLDDYAEFLAAFCNKLDIKPYCLIGHSNGGAIVVRGLAAGVLHTEKLLLLASAGIRNEDRSHKRLLKLAAKTGKIITRPLPVSVRSRMRGKLYKGIGSDLLVAEHMQATFKKIIVDDIRISAAQITVPSLLIYGTSDDRTPVSHAISLCEQISGASLQTIEGAGHFLQIDKLEELVRSSKAFLE